MIGDVVTIDVIGLVRELVGRIQKTLALIAGAPFPFPFFSLSQPPPLPFLRLPRRLEETAVVHNFVGCLYTDVAKTTLRNFRQFRTAFSGKLPKARGPFCLSAPTLARFFFVEIFDSSKKVILSLHFMSLAVRDRQ